MELKYTLEEIQEAGELVLVELLEEEVTRKTFSIEKVTPESVHFHEVITPFAVTPFGKTKRFAKELILNPKVRARTNKGFIYCYALVLEKDVDVAISEIKKVASQKIDEKMKQLEIQRDLVNSL